MTIMVIYSTVFASGTRWKLDRKQQWELYFWKWTLEPLRIVHGILFGAVEMDQNEITVVLFSQICLSIKGYFSKLNLVVFNQAKFDSIVLISYCYSNATWNGVLGWLTPTTSTYTQVISVLQTLHPPECGVWCLLLPLAMLVEICEGACGESEWHHGHFHSFILAQVLEHTKGPPSLQ